MKIGVAILAAAALGVTFTASVHASILFDPNTGYTAAFGSTLAPGWGVCTLGGSGSSMYSLPTDFTSFTAPSSLNFDNTYVQGDNFKRVASTLYGVQYPTAGSNNWGLCLSPTSCTAEAMSVALSPTAPLVDPTLDVTYRLVGAGAKQYGGTNPYPGLYCYYSINGGTTWTRIQSLDSNVQAGVTTQTQGFNWQSTDQTFPVAGIPDTTLGTTKSFHLQLTGVTVPAGSTIEFRWLEGNSGPYSPETNVAITSFGVNAVPEPATLSLLGLAGLAMIRRRA